MVAKTLAIVAIALALRLPFLYQAVQGDDVYFLHGAEHAQIDPLHPTHARFLFQGDLVDMRGHSHPPLNSWILGALLAALGDVKEVPFHLAYALFSVVAALAMWSLARRFCDQPFLATLLFLAVPAFVINGNSLESDVPFLALWMSAIALFVKAVEDDTGAALFGAAGTGALAALMAYQGVFLVLVLGAYLLVRRKHWVPAWSVVLAAPVALGAWQLFERATSDQLPAAMLAGYLRSYAFEALANKARSAAALVAHLGWVVSPMFAFFFARDSRRRWILALLAAAAAAFYDQNPLFWVSVACGVLILASCFRLDFLEAWILVFFAACLAVFFSGSARYLLPLAAPVAILAARSSSPRVLATGFGLQMALSLGLAFVNYQHWDAYRRFAASLAGQLATHRVWINAEWGLVYYLESEGALPMPKGQLLQPGEMVVSSALAYPIPMNAALVPFAQTEIRPWLPLRLISLDGRSAYSVASPRGLLPFELSTATIDRVRAEVVIERKPVLSYLEARDPQSAPQIISGWFPDGWMTDQATVLLKRPVHPAPLRAVIYIHPQSPARHVRMLVDGQLAAEETFPGPGAYTLAIPASAGSAEVTVTLIVDKTFSAPGDQRKLGIMITGIGFR